MNTTNPLISIVTVCYNAIEDIEKTMMSIINQKYKNIEYIIIDGGSIDGTIEIIKKYHEKVSFWKSEPDLGIYDAMNKGISIAEGEWINFMNVGDMFVDECIVETLFAEKIYNDNIGVIYGDCYIKKRNKVLLEKANPFWKNRQYIHGKGFCHQSTFVRTKLAKHIPFDISFDNSADFKQCNDIYRMGYLFEYIQIPICFFDHTKSFFSKHLGIVIKEDAQIINHYNTPKYYIVKFKIEISFFLDRLKWKTINKIKGVNCKSTNKELGYKDISEVTNAMWAFM